MQESLCFDYEEAICEMCEGKNGYWYPVWLGRVVFSFMNLKNFRKRLMDKLLSCRLLQLSMRTLQASIYVNLKFSSSSPLYLVNLRQDHACN